MPLHGSLADAGRSDEPAVAVPWVATFDGYGPIKIGMTEDQVLAVAGQPLHRERFSNGCVALAVGSGADWRELSVWFDKSTGRVSGIKTPLGTTTDRGVGDGATGADVDAAYAGRAIIDRREGYPGTTIVQVTPQTGGEHFIAFAEEGGTVGAPMIDRVHGQEGCDAVGSRG